MIKIGFTGTQNGMTRRQHRVLLVELTKLWEPGSEFHHGDCIGADEQAHDLAYALRYLVVIHPPADSSRRAFCCSENIWRIKPYLIRNRDIVDSTELLIATPKTRDEEFRSGTWSTVRYARKKNKPIHVIYPGASYENIDRTS